MSTRVVDRVDDWDEQPFSGGFSGLSDLSADEFSGVVRAGAAELYMTKGVVVGIRRGDIDDFENASGTAFVAPSPALPLLAIMQENSDEVRDSFYTEKTAIAEVDKTLASGGFTGFIELSENVLSGDYYLVYHAGESMSVGFVGESKRLIDGDEAFQTADDEVGIYEVRPVDVDPIEIPAASETSPAAESDDDSADVDEAAGDEADEEGDAIAATADKGGGTAAAAAEDAQQTSVDEPETPPSEPSESSQEPPESRDPPEPAADQHEQQASTEQSSDHVQPEATTGTQPSTAEASTQQPVSEPAKQSPDRQPERGGSNGTQAASGSSEPQSATRRRSQPSPGGASATADLERRAIPSLDPSRTKLPEKPDPKPREPQGQEPTEQASQPTQTEPVQEAEQQPPSQPAQEPADPDRVAELEDELEAREAEIDRLEDELATARDDTDELEAELEQLREERDDLATEVEELESELTRLEEELGAATGDKQRMTPAEALRGTDIFIRYRSKGDATLEKAHSGSHRRTDVNENLRLEKHTQFDRDAVSIGGRTYEEFLDSTTEYQFIEWAVRDLLFEIRETGHKKALKDLYDVLPAVDRAELAGVVEVVYTEDGQETRTQESFDIVLRDRMGNPLLVANLNDSREGATEAMMEGLITAAERVGQSVDEFSGAFLVTRSFFEPGALEVASDATQGGILSRDKRKSYVNISRKQGYHLCLVEARNENFHLAVPEL